MLDPPADDPILKRFRAALDELYGDRIERVVLFGSRARGDEQIGSDYDVAVFLKGFTDRWQEVDRIVPLVTAILYEDGAFIRGLPRRSHLADAGNSAAKASIFDARSEGAFRQGPSMLGPRELFLPPE